MYLLLFNIICWIITFSCFYVILHPNITIFKKIHKSPYKELVNLDFKKSFNVINILKHRTHDELRRKYQLFKNNFNVIIFNFNGSLNVGSIMRTACVYGCDKYYILGRKIYDTRPCVGSNKYIDLHIIKNIVTVLPDKNHKPVIDNNKFKQFMIKNKLAPIFVEQGGKNIMNFSFKQYLNITSEYTPTFIFGNETYGMDINFMHHCRGIPGFTVITIPQPGLLKSLNVSNSASIIFWEYYRQILYKKNVNEKYSLEQSVF